MPTPLARSLANSIVQGIRDGSVAEGKPLPAERDLSVQFEVSRGVVRQAVDILSREGWLSRQPNCRPVVARGATFVDRTKADHISVWLWPSTSDYVASSVFRGVQDALKGSGFRLVVGTARKDGNWDDALHEEVDFLNQVAEDASCAGALLWPIGEQELMGPLERCQASRLPLVFVDREPPLGWTGDVVSTDNYGSSREVAGHFLKQGHRKIAILTNRDSASSVRDRINGFMSALKEGNTAEEPEMIIFSPIGDEPDGDAFRRALRPMLARNDRPTALYCINDSLALGALDCLEELGVSVPGQMSVVGFDGLLRWLPGGGRLTSAHQDFRRIGELAAQLLLQRISERGDPDIPRRHFLLQAPLVVRETSATLGADRTASLNPG